MNALLLAPEPPYPVIGGGPLRTASIAEWLLQHASVHLVTFHDPAYPQLDIPAHKFSRIDILPLPLHQRDFFSRATRNLKRAYRGSPALIDRFQQARPQLASLLADRSYDLALFEHFWSAPFLPLVHARTHILDLHNIESQLSRRLAESYSPSAILHREFAHAYEQLERLWIPRFPHVLVTSPADQQHVPGALVVPNTIPFAPRPSVAKQPYIAFSGNLAYEPNRQALIHFHRDIWPLIQRQMATLKLHLIGKNPDALPATITRDPSILTTGFVDDALPLLAAAQVAIVPLLSGSGTRIKILEAFAAGAPVVSTSIGAEGLPVTSPQHLLLADHPENFAACVTHLLRHPNECERIAANARQLWERQFTWQAAWNTLDRDLLPYLTSLTR